MSLDPDDFSELRRLGHRMLDDLFDDLAALREGPVWQRTPDAARAEFSASMPLAPSNAADVYGDYRRLVAPYGVGNRHPAFMGWVHGGGTAVGMLAELLAGGLNANCGGRDHAPILVERQVVAWVAAMLGFPEGAGGVLLTGSSMANLCAVLCARVAHFGADVRRAGSGGFRARAYASAAAHGCVPRAMDMAGLGTDALRVVGCDAHGRIDVAALRAAVARDRAAGDAPFIVVGSAGTVDIGAIDDLSALAGLCADEKLWFHVDGAFGALGMLAPELRPKLRGIERADSVALDFHKWAQVPYDAGCLAVREQTRLLETFAAPAAYLRREDGGLAGGSPWPCDLGPELSRGFRALKVWMTLRVFGADRLGEMIENTCAIARHLAARVDAEPALERMAPVALDIVCFRHRGLDDAGNAAVVRRLHELGVAAPSTTTLDGRLAIRAAIVNHRTRAEDADALVDAVLAAASQSPNKLPIESRSRGESP